MTKVEDGWERVEDGAIIDWREEPWRAGRAWLNGRERRDKIFQAKTGEDGWIVYYKPDPAGGIPYADRERTKLRTRTEWGSVVVWLRKSPQEQPQSPTGTRRAPVRTCGASRAVLVLLSRREP